MLPILLYSQCVALGISICVGLFITITLCLGEHVECFREIFTESWAIFWWLEINQRTTEIQACLLRVSVAASCS